MNLSQFISTVKQVCLLHKGVAQFNSGDVYETMNSGTQHYPAIVLTINNLTGTEDSQSYNCNLFYIDRLTDDESNKTDVQSESITVLKDIQAKMKENLAIDIAVTSYTPFTEKFADLCSGSYLDCIMTIPENVICSDSNFDSRELEVKTNGVYSTIGYDKVKVATKTKTDPVLETITIESNGHYEPAEGVDGYNNIDVNVPTPEPKLETLNVTDNGTYDAPAEIDGYNKVVVDVPSEVNDPFGFDTIGYTPETMPIIKDAVDYAKRIKDEWDPNTDNLDYKWYLNNDIQYMPVIDTSNVKSCNRTFYGATRLIYTPHSMDLSKCNFFYAMFRDSSIINAPKIIMTGDVNVGEMFSNCRMLTTVPSLNVSEVTDFNRMFEECSNLVSIGALDMSKGVNFERTFSGIAAPPSNYVSPSPIQGYQAKFDLPNGMNFERAFSNWTRMTNLYSLEVNGADECTFYAAFDYNYIPILSLGTTKPAVLRECCNNNGGILSFCTEGLDCSRVRSSIGMFNYCYSLSNIGVLRNLGQAYNEGPLTSDYPYFKDEYTDRWTTTTFEFDGHNLTDQSIANIFEGLYDVSGYNLNGAYGVDATLAFNPNIYARITDEQKESATSKGWIVIEYN